MSFWKENGVYNQNGFSKGNTIKLWFPARSVMVILAFLITYKKIANIQKFHLILVGKA